MIIEKRNILYYLSPTRILNHIIHLIKYKPYQWRIQKWENHKQKGKEFLVARLDNNIHIRLYTDSVLCELIYKGGFEEDEISFVRHYLKKGDVFFDIGANIGLFSLIGAERVGQQGRVFSFEPADKTYKRLLENIMLNGFSNIVTEKKALSNHMQKLELKTSLNGFDAWNSLASPSFDGQYSCESVNTITIDRYLSENPVNLDNALFKIDVEGWELNVLKGGIETFSINHYAPLLIEFCDETARGAGISCNEIYEFLTALGYKFYTFDRSKRRLVPDPLRESYPYTNLIATKDVNQIVKRMG